MPNTIQKATPSGSQSVVLLNPSVSNPAQNTYEIDLVELFLHLVARWKSITLVTLLAALAAFLITSFLITPKYEATSTIYVLSRKDSAVNISDLQIGSALTQDYIQVFDIWEVHEKVISNLDLPYTYEELSKMLKVTNKADTRMLDIAITSPNPEEAAAIANEYAEVASDFIAETMATEKPNIVSTALVPTNPVSPSLVRNVAIGALIGLVVICGFYTVLYVSDDKIKVPDDISRYTTLTTLAIMPLETKRLRKASPGRSYNEGKHAHAKSTD